MPLMSETFFSKQYKDLYFNIVKIDNENKKNDWINFSENAGTVKVSDGVYTFQKCLKYYNNPLTEVWVAYVSDKPVTHPDTIDRSNLEMYVSVTTSEHAPFITHMGIQRVPSNITHKNISTQLHGFCAKFMHDSHPDKLFMINTPQEFMREILSNNLKDKENSIYIYDNGSLHITPETIELQKNRIKSIIDSGGQLRPTTIPNLHLKESLLAQREKISEGQLFPNIITDTYNTFVVIGDKYDGHEIAKLDKNNHEFDWFFNSYDLISYGFNGVDTPMISVDLLALAELSPEF